MLLDLSELLVCPVCGPPRSMVVGVDRMEDRRVLEGRLACPDCGARVPVRRGVVRLDLRRGGGGSVEGGPVGSGSVDRRSAGRGSAGRPSRADRPGREGTGGGESSAPELLSGLSPGEAALRLAALLGVERDGGFLLVGVGLGGLASALSRLTEAEVVALEDEPLPEGPQQAHVSRLQEAGGGGLPFVDASMEGVALVAPDGPLLREAARLLRPGRRLVSLGPSGAERKGLPVPDPELAASGLEPLAVESGTVVARRTRGETRGGN